MCCDSWGHKELDMTERLNGTELKLLKSFPLKLHILRLWMKIINLYLFSFFELKETSNKILNY